MGEPTTGIEARWRLRAVPEPLARRYVAEGWWNDTTLGAERPHLPEWHARGW